MTTPSALDQSYVDHVAALEKRLGSDDALRHAVGGEFLAIGRLEYQLLRSRGLRGGQFVVDVGCGSGRLACQLAPFADIRYVGCDVVPRLLEYAASLCGRPDWVFATTNGAQIPCDDGVADFVCFFSVFTHLHQEEIYRYLREAHRVLKPGGLVLMSFLEFRNESHWATFIASVDGTRDDNHLNQFVERDAIRAWAAPIGFEVRNIHGGDTSYIPLAGEVVFENGSVVRGATSLGQSLAVLQKRRGSAALDQPESSPEPAATRPGGGSGTGGANAALKNASARAMITAGGTTTVGFILARDARVLVRAVGPTLRVFGVAQPVERPLLELHSGDVQRASAGAWGGDGALAAASARAGAFSLAPESGDAALVIDLAAGSHTAVVRSADPAESGEVLIEIYVL